MDGMLLSQHFQTHPYHFSKYRWIPEIPMKSSVSSPFPDSLPSPYCSFLWNPPCHHDFRSNPTNSHGIATKTTISSQFPYIFPYISPWNHHEIILHFPIFQKKLPGTQRFFPHLAPGAPAARRGGRLRSALRRLLSGDAPRSAAAGDGPLQPWAFGVTGEAKRIFKSSGIKQIKRP